MPEILSQYLNPKTHQLITVTPAEEPENPLELDYLTNGDSESAFKIVIDKFNCQDIFNELANDLFNGDLEKFQEEHDKVNNTQDLFENLSIIAKQKNKLIYPITKYEHSEIQYYIGADCGWDRGACGYILVDQAKNPAKNEKETIENYLNPILNDFSDYINGYVYDVSIEDLNEHNEPTNEEKYDFYTAYANSFDYDNLKQVLDNFGISQQQDWHPAITETKIRYKIAK